jgi:hypothetical protein
MKRIFIAVLALFSLTAFASPGDDGCVGNCSPNGQGANADSRARAKAYAAAMTHVEQNVIVNPASVTVQPTAQPLTINNNLPAQPEQKGKVGVRTVPDVFAGNVYPTTSCAHSAAAGASALGWGVSLGGSYLDDECGVRETARSFQNLNMTADALAVLCSSKYSAVAPACKALRADPR